MLPLLQSSLSKFQYLPAWETLNISDLHGFVDVKFRTGWIVPDM